MKYSNWTKSGKRLIVGGISSENVPNHSLDISIICFQQEVVESAWLRFNRLRIKWQRSSTDLTILLIVKNI